MRFEGKVVAVVGAGCVGKGWGNGKAAATLYAREGAHVVAGDIDLSAAQDTQKLIEGEGGHCTAVRIDATSEDSVATFFNHISGQHGRIDVLHNNVGASQIKATEELSLHEWESNIALNLHSVFLTARSAIPMMKQRKSGVIVNTSSIGDRRWVGVPFAAYTTAKAGLVALTQTIALEHARNGIRANVVVPGFMDTPTIVAPYSAVVGDEIEQMKQRRHNAVPLGHMGDAWDIAKAAAFLASDDARYITGTELVVDGGLTRTIGFQVT